MSVLLHIRFTNKIAEYYSPLFIAPSLFGEAGGRESLINSGLFLLCSNRPTGKEGWNFLFPLGAFSFLSSFSSLTCFSSFVSFKGDYS